MNLSTIKQEVRSVLDEVSASRYSDAEILRWINAAERDIAFKSGCLEDVLSLATSVESRLVTFTGFKVNHVLYTVGGTYSFPVNWVGTWKDTMATIWKDTSDTIWKDSSQDNLSVTNPSRSLQRITPKQLGRIDLHSSIIPQYYFQWGSYLVIEPRPTVSYNLEVFVSVYPSNQMTGDSDVPEIPEEFQHCIFPYVYAMAMLKIRRWKSFFDYYKNYISVLQRGIDMYVERQKTKYIELKIPTLSREVQQR